MVMKEYTQQEALVDIFKGKGLSKTMNVYRHRYSKGVLSQKAIDDILLVNGFEVVKEKIYIKS